MTRKMIKLWPINKKLRTRIRQAVSQRCNSFSSYPMMDRTKMSWNQKGQTWVPTLRKLDIQRPSMSVSCCLSFQEKKTTQSKGYRSHSKSNQCSNLFDSKWMRLPQKSEGGKFALNIHFHISLQKDWTNKRTGHSAHCESIQKHLNLIQINKCLTPDLKWTTEWRHSEYSHTQNINKWSQGFDRTPDDMQQRWDVQEWVRHQKRNFWPHHNTGPEKHQKHTNVKQYTQKLLKIDNFLSKPRYIVFPISNIWWTDIFAGRAIDDYIRTHVI